MTRIAIISPITALRAGIRSLIDGHPDLQVTWETPTFSGLIPGLLEAEVFIAVGMVIHSQDFARLKESQPQAAVLFLVSSENEARPLIRIIRGTVWGLLPVEIGTEELVAAIRALAQGLVVISPMFVNLLDTFQPIKDENAQVEELSQREREVLSLLAEGMANKQIALRLGISEHTAKFHISSILDKLGVINRTEAVRKGIQQGLIKI